ncbi:nuclear transport factor 2 family protein [Roseomonas chloroacetimidivorans]|jgi:hypothetical protein|uniref:nuclear transport factor 2 family protein n=1 Tax=Roseomonas chloroacetimidivorans TaxID=1766656 RepID=UPI003C727ABC
MQDEIRALEARRYTAMKTGNVSALAGLLSERLVYSHSDATQDSKASYLETLSNGTLRYLDVWFETKSVLEAGDHGAVALGTMGAKIIRHGEEKTIGAMTCAVWACEGGVWRLLAYQPTALPKK